MPLKDYEKKRDFEKTGEPSGNLGEAGEHVLRFVIHKHQARRLHFDLRLELDGVLKSWAVPKGLSLDPSQKRLAVMVEDHPVEYRNFEGTIPEGNYGAGTVIIWDEGTYFHPDGTNSETSSQLIRNGLAKGNIAFVLAGKKTKGMFHLVKLRQSAKQNWLIIKKPDQYASTEEASNNDYSVRSGRTLQEIANQSVQSTNKNTAIEKIDLTGAKRITVPPGPFKPMLAYLSQMPFDNPDWIFEIKWDGYRAIAELQHGTVQLYSRNGINFLPSYPPVVKDLQSLEIKAVLDGEIVVTDSQGKANFGLLQNYKRTQIGTIVYYVFDLLFFNDYDLRMLPLVQRKSILKQILPNLIHVKYNDHIEQFGKAFFQLAEENHLEGIMAKDKKSRYLNGIRSREWQKIKTHLKQEAVIGGFTEPKGGRTGFGALLVGIYEKGELIFSGSVGGGFTDSELHQIHNRLLSLKRDLSPFKNIPPALTRVTWIEPVLVCEITFAEWTQDGFMRQPVFSGFREDLAPQEVHREGDETQTSSQPYYSINKNDEVFLSINNTSLKITNLKKHYWPHDGITKGDTIDYYRAVAPFILPHLFDRPESLHRFPDGIGGKSFYHKDIADAPDWLETITIQSDSAHGSIRYVLCQNEAALVYIVNLGALEINPWSSRVGMLELPDYIVIDLDPLECSFDDVIRCALAAHSIMESIDLPHFIKTSGATGMHIFIPAGAKYDYEQARQFSYLICTLINTQLPNITSIERAPSKRSGKVYLDFLQNSQGKTMAAPYSLRPLANAPVSTPLIWDEVKPGLRPEQFTINSILQRLDHYGDLWQPVLGPGIDMKYYLGKLGVLLKIA